MTSHKFDDVASDIDDASMVVEELQVDRDVDGDEKLDELHKTLEHATDMIDEIVIVDGSLADRRLTALYRRGDRLVACLAVNQPRVLTKYRKLLADSASWEAALSGTGSSPC